MAMSVSITIREGKGYLTNLPPELDEPLVKATSFRPAGFQYDWRFKRGKWDGWVHLYKHHKFPAGLLGRVLTVMREQGVPYELSSDTVKDDKPELKGTELDGIEQRWYQDEAVEAAILSPRGVIRAPTGSGKTAIAARIIHTRARWAVVVVPTIDLLYQTKEFFEAHFIDNSDRYGDPTGGTGWGRPVIGQLGDGVVDSQPVTVATARTMAKVLGVAYERYEFGEYDDKDDTEVDRAALREWIESIGTLIVDEAHILGAQTVFDLATKLPAPNKYGMSASPWRDDGADLMIEAATGPPIYRIGTDALVRDGFLVPPIIRVEDTRTWWTAKPWGQTCAHCGKLRWKDATGPVKKCTCGSDRWRSEFPDAYKHEIVENAIRNERIARLVPTLPGPHLVLVKQVKHGRELAKLIPESRFLSGKDPGGERKRVYDDLRAGNIQTVIATTIADMGLDLPILRTLVLAAGGKSSTRHLQRIGRVARPFPGKQSALVVDLDDSHVHKWFREHAKARRKIEKAEWAECAIWI